MFFTARMSIVGLGLGPVHHYYYLYIAKILPKRDLMTVFTKIGMDQFIMSPLCIAGFFYSMGTLERKPVEKMNEEIVKKFLDVYVVRYFMNQYLYTGSFTQKKKHVPSLPWEVGRFLT